MLMRLYSINLEKTFLCQIDAYLGRLQTFTFLSLQLAKDNTNVYASLQLELCHLTAEIAYAYNTLVWKVLHILNLNWIVSVMRKLRNCTGCLILIWSSVPTDRRSFRTGPKKIQEDRSVQDLKIAKRTSKDLFFDPGTIIRFFKMDSLEF